MTRQLGVLILLAAFGLAACSGPMKKTMELRPGVPKEAVLAAMGTPYDRSFSGDNEAWQYMSVVGYGQCEYVTVWLQSGVLHSVTSRRGASIAGCGLGSQPVDWGQFKPYPVDVQVSVK